MRGKSRGALVALLTIWLGLSSGAHAGAPEEAERQAGFAQAELEAGDYHRALKSAESALRLDPTRYDAFLLKARAYEGLGSLELARSLVLAYGELVGGLEDRPAAQAILDRLREVQLAEEQPRQKRQKQRPRALTPAQEPVLPPDPLDPTPYRERVVAALADGRCNAASSAATELTLAAPQVADGWKLAGDAARCGSDLRAALLAYRRYLRQGGQEASTLALIGRLESMFATLLVRVDAPAQAAPIRARLDVDGEDLLAEPTAEGPLRIRDLPPGHPFKLVVSGRGLRPIELSIEPLKAGEARGVSVTPEWLGLATVTLADFGGAARVVLVTEDSEVVAEPGQSYAISAASVWAQVENEFGTQSIPLEVTPDTELTFDPAPYLPARLAVAGAPAGSTVEVDVTADDGRVDSQTALLPSDVGELDLDTGVRVAPVRSFDSLPGGLGVLRVSHPTLGAHEAELVLETGALNAATFKWRELPGVSSAVEAFSVRRQEADLAKRARARTVALGVASGAFAGVAAGLLAGALVHGDTADQARDRAVEAHRTGDGAGLSAAIDDFKSAREMERGLGVGAGVGFGLAGVGLTVTFGRTAAHTAGRPRPAAPK